MAPWWRTMRSNRSDKKLYLLELVFAARAGPRAELTQQLLELPHSRD